MRILYVYEGKIGTHGIDNVVREQLRALSSCGCTIDLVSRGNPGFAGINFEGARWTSANTLSWLPRKFYYAAQRREFMRRGARLAERRDYAKVISWRERALFSFRRAKPKGAGCFLNHDSMHWREAVPVPPKSRWPSLTRPQMDEEFKLAAKILLPSTNSKESFLRNGEPADKLEVISRGVDTASFVPNYSRETSKFRLVYCGRVCERKGIRQVVEAWKVADLPEAELVVMGTVAPELESFVAENAGTKNIRWLGFIRDTREILRSSHAQILLSRREGMAKALLEGAACGLATITTKDTGFPLSEGENGYLVEREDIRKVADLLRHLHQNRGLCTTLGTKGRLTVLQNYSWEAFRHRFIRAVGLACREV